MISARVIVVLVTLAVAVMAAIPADKITEPLPNYTGSQPIDFDMYSGYVDVDANAGRSLFYWFAESQNDPSSDPVVLWLNGGPGCSSLDGFFYEHGPFKFDRSVGGTNDNLHYNPFSWNMNANLIYLEAPAGVGFSYSNTSSDYFTNDNQTAIDNYQFLASWFESYPEYSSNDFYISGESYAGVYVPTLAYYLHEQNQISSNNFINLKGILVGNGVTWEQYDGSSFIEFSYNHALYSPNLHNELVEGNCKNSASIRCTELELSVYLSVGNINFYDIYRRCYSGPDDEKYLYDKFNTHNGHVHNRNVGESVPCLNSRAATDLLNQDSFRSIVHAKSVADIGEWAICSSKLVYKKIYDAMPRGELPIYETLTQNYKVLIYSGDVDGSVPYVGTIGWIQDLEGYATPTYDWVAWNTGGDQEAGFFTVYDEPYPLTFTTIKGAGHMVPEYKPPQAFAFFDGFLKGTFPPTN